MHMRANMSILCMMVVFSAGYRVSADQPTDRSLPLAQASERAKNAESTPARENVANRQSSDIEEKVLEFVGQHQPRLLKLLSFMKDKQPVEYQQALKEMSRSQLRLENLAKRDQELHAVELELWQVRSHLRLLAAEISVAKQDDRPILEEQLEKLVESEIARDLARIRLVRLRALKQIEQYDEQIALHTENPNEQLAKAIKTWQSKISKQSSRGEAKVRSSNKP